MKKNSNIFWNKRAINKKVPGSNDPFLDFFETKKIISLIKKKNKLNILDVGCGSGELLQKINKKNKIKHGIGIDFSKEMILKANKQNNFKSIQYFNLDMNYLHKLEILADCNMLSAPLEGKELPDIVKTGKPTLIASIAVR